MFTQGPTFPYFLGSSTRCHDSGGIYGPHIPTRGAASRPSDLWSTSVLSPISFPVGGHCSVAAILGDMMRDSDCPITATRESCLPSDDPRHAFPSESTGRASSAVSILGYRGVFSVRNSILMHLSDSCSASTSTMPANTETNGARDATTVSEPGKAA